MDILPGGPLPPGSAVKSKTHTMFFGNALSKVISGVWPSA
jgi:hypothetical protein